MNIRNGIENSNLTRAATSLPDPAVRSSTGASSAQSGSAIGAGSDQAHLSSAAAHLAAAMPASGVNGDVRTQLVQRVQSALANGAYHVPASSVADKVMQSMLANE